MRRLSGGKGERCPVERGEAFRRKVMDLSCGKGESFPVSPSWCGTVYRIILTNNHTSLNGKLINSIAITN